MQYYVCFEHSRRPSAWIVRSGQWAELNTRKFGPYDSYREAHKKCKEMRGWTTPSDGSDERGDFTPLKVARSALRQIGVRR